jgi:hypothetical protein
MMIPFLQAFLAQEERWPARWRQRRRLSGLAEVTEVASDARGGSDERTQPHASTAAITLFDVDREGPLFILHLMQWA